MIFSFFIIFELYRLNLQQVIIEKWLPFKKLLHVEGKFIGSYFPAADKLFMCKSTNFITEQVESFSHLFSFNPSKVFYNI